jgi:hypothetical protein
MKKIGKFIYIYIYKKKNEMKKLLKTRPHQFHKVMLTVDQDLTYRRRAGVQALL